MQRLALHIIFGNVAHPKYNVLQWFAVDNGNTNNIFKPIREIFGGFYKLLVCNGFDACDAILGEIEDFAVRIRRTNQIPTVVVLFEQIRMETHPRLCRRKR